VERYDVDISSEAEKDLGEILDYIKNVLLEPDIATRFLELIKEKINGLEYFPERYGFIEDELIKSKEYRKLIIKNYIAVYRVDIVKKKVDIVRVVYEGRNLRILL